MAIGNIFIWGSIAFIAVLLMFALGKLVSWIRNRNRTKRDLFEEERRRQGIER